MMLTLKNVVIPVIALLIHYAVNLEAAEAESLSKNATIIIVGLSDVGKSDVVSQLFNWKRALGQGNNDFDTKLHEYRLQLDTSEVDSLRIVDVPGFVLDKKHEEDAETLALLANYLREEWQQQKPSLVLITSTYADNRAGGESSNFVQMLKRVELLKNELLVQDESSNRTNCIFLFTQLGQARSDGKTAIARKLSMFKDIIRNYTKFRDPIVAVVGENDADGYRLQRDEEGFTKLSNGELYPKNLLDKMAELASDAGDAPAHAAVKILRQNYGVNKVGMSGEPILSEISYLPNDELKKQKAKFLQQITGEMLQVSSTSEVAIALQNAWDTEVDFYQKQRNPTALVLLLKTLQNLNITERIQLPSTTAEIVELFLRLPNHEIYAQLLDKAFDIRQPELYVQLVAGYGYDLVTDSVLDSSPWNLGTSSPVSSELGYKLPPEYIVNKVNQSHEIFQYMQDIEEYVATRLKDLGTIPVEHLTLKDFRGQVRLAYNVKPLAGEEQHFTVSAIKEFHTFQLEMNEAALTLNPDFVSQVERLQPFNPTDRESEKEWKRFFGEYGTHVVLSAFGGGYMQATIEMGSNIRDLDSSAFRDRLKDSLLDFAPLPESLKSSTAAVVPAFFGGSPTRQMQQIHNLDENKKQVLMADWTSSLRFTPIVMQTQLTLKPISQLISTINSTIGATAEEAAQLLYAGRLKFQTSRRSGGSKPRNPTTTTTTTVRPTPRTETTTLPPRSTTRRPPQASTTQGYSWSLNYRSTSTESPRQNNWNSNQPSATVCTDNRSKINLIDDSELHVGFGYNMFHDSGVAASPFELVPLQNEFGIEFFANANVTSYSPELYNSSCVILRSKRDYILRRISDIEPHDFKTWTSYASIQQLKEGNFPSTVKPGYSIVTNPYKASRISAIREHKLYKVFLDNWKRLDLSASFKAEFHRLPAYRHRDCHVKTKWVNFIQKYGTHVVVSRNAGYSNELAKHVKFPSSTLKTVIPVDACSSLYQSVQVALKAGNPLYYQTSTDGDGTDPTEFKREEMELNYLNLDMKFEELSNILKEYDYMKGSDMDSAIRDIWDFGFGC